MATSELAMTRTVDEDGTMVLHLAGEVDAWSAGRVQHEALGIVGSDNPIAIDLSEVTFLDSRGLAALVGVSRTLTAAGRTLLELRSVPTGLARIIDLAGTTPVFRLEPAPT